MPQDSLCGISPGEFSDPRIMKRIKQASRGCFNFRVELRLGEVLLILAHAQHWGRQQPKRIGDCLRIVLHTRVAGAVEIKERSAKVR